jgi:RNA polymerase sigma factor (TIGR02999 family)
VQWQNRQEFFAIAAKLVRRILVDHARRRQAAKRGSDAPKIAFDEALGVPNLDDPALIALDEALKDLEATDPRGSRVVELHAFGGLTFEEIAQTMELSRGTVFRDWKHARLWLRRELRKVTGEGEEEE